MGLKKETFGEVGEKIEVSAATVAGRCLCSAGNVDAVSAFARNACRKIFGECHAMALPGNARIAVSGTDSETSKTGRFVKKSKFPAQT